MISPIDKQISKSMNYLKYVKDINEAREAKAKGIQFIRHLLERQEVKNNQNELDKITWEIAHNEMWGLTSHAMNKRKETPHNLVKLIN